MITENCSGSDYKHYFVSIHIAYCHVLQIMYINMYVFFLLQHVTRCFVPEFLINYLCIPLSTTHNVFEYVIPLKIKQNDAIFSVTCDAWTSFLKNALL